MSVPAADPHWGWWITWYFYLGGIAAGAYFLATLAEFFGSELDRRRTRVGYLIAAPLVAICGVLLIADLTKPARFWHMLLDHDTWRPHLKFWSPMSIGAWALLLFGLISSASFIGLVAEFGWLGLSRFQTSAARLHRGLLGRIFDSLGVLCGFFIASYTGVLLTASNQPVWSDSPWIGTLFLASSAGTGLATIRILAPWVERTLRTPDTAGAETMSESMHSSFDSMEPWIWALELAAAALLLRSLGSTTLQTLVGQGLAVPFLGGALGLGVVVPALLRLKIRRRQNVVGIVAAVSVLIGGFFLRYTVLVAPRAVRSAAGHASVPSDHVKNAFVVNVTDD